MTSNQKDFITWVIDLAPAVEVAAQYAEQSDEHLHSALELYCDHLHQALSLITELAKEDPDSANG